MHVLQIEFMFCLEVCLVLDFDWSLVLLGIVQVFVGDVVDHISTPHSSSVLPGHAVARRNQ